jgi:polyhydroxyalkanoate synthesis regulator protein
MRGYMKESFGGMLPVDRFEEMTKQNMAFFEQAMRMWNPFKGGVPGMPGMPGATGGNSAGPSSAAPKPADAPSATEINDLKSQMSALQRQIEALTKNAGGNKGE